MKQSWSLFTTIVQVTLSGYPWSYGIKFVSNIISNNFDSCQVYFACITWLLLFYYAYHIYNINIFFRVISWMTNTALIPVFLKGKCLLSLLNVFVKKAKQQWDHPQFSHIMVLLEALYTLFSCGHCKCRVVPQNCVP